MPRNIKKSRRLESNQFTQLWVVLKHDYQKSQGILAKYSKEQGCYNLRLSSDCNLGKGLSKSRRKSQLVKYKDIELYL